MTEFVSKCLIFKGRQSHEFGFPTCLLASKVTVLCNPAPL